VLYNHRADPPQQLRHRCRNPRCGGNLKIPATNPRDAFCRPICEHAFYGCRCRVCEQLFNRKTRRRIVCSRAQCQSRFWRHPEDFSGARYPYSPLRYNEEKTSLKTTSKTGTKSGRGYRIIAGPAVDPINFGNWPELPKPRKVLIGRTTPPVNVIGGYRFPDAPKVDLSSTHADRVLA
jgi:hypothetical protein